MIAIASAFYLNALFLRQDFTNIVWYVCIPLEVKGLTCDGIFYPSEKNLLNFLSLFLHLLSRKSMKYFRKYKKSMKM